jgi:hypothetical protein
MYNYPMQKAIFFISFLLLTTIHCLLNTSPVYAQGAKWSNVCISTVDPTVPTIQGFECLFANVLKVIVTVAGLAFVIMFIVGGFQYMQSKNDPKAVAAASSTLTYAIIGLVGAIVSWLILLFIKDFTGIDITQFRIPT